MERGGAGGQSGRGNVSLSIENSCTCKDPIPYYFGRCYRPILLRPSPNVSNERGEAARWPPEHWNDHFKSWDRSGIHPLKQYLPECYNSSENFQFGVVNWPNSKWWPAVTILVFITNKWTRFFYYFFLREREREEGGGLYFYGLCYC